MTLIPDLKMNLKWTNCCVWPVSMVYITVSEEQAIGIVGHVIKKHAIPESLLVHLTDVIRRGMIPKMITTGSAKDFIVSEFNEHVKILHMKLVVHISSGEIVGSQG